MPFLQVLYSDNIHVPNNMSSCSNPSTSIEFFSHPTISNIDNNIHLLLLEYAKTTNTAKMMITMMCTGNYFRNFTYDDIITFLSSILSNIMVSLALSPESISTISPSPKTLCLLLSPISKFAIYFINLSMVFLASSDSAKVEIIR